MRSLCSCSRLTLQVLVSGHGLPALVALLSQPIAAHALVAHAIDGLKAVLDLRGRSPRNDLCRTLVGLDAPALLVAAIAEIHRSHAAHAERGAELF